MNGLGWGWAGFGGGGRFRSLWRVGSGKVAAMRPRLRPLFIGLGPFGLTLACQFPQENTSSFTTNVMLSAGSSGVVETTGAGGGTTAGEASGTTPGVVSGSEEGPGSVETSGGPGTVLDVGAMGDVGDGKPRGCRGKIDFLFVISRYGTMQYYQQQLLAAFPDFIETIKSEFADFDYHIMVVDGDSWWGGTDCDAECPMQCTPGYPCGYTPTTCDMIMGTGTVFPAGYFASNQDCGIAGGRRYMTKDQPNLEKTFECVARIGTSGAPWMGEALAAAVQHNLNGPGGCNGGFLRKDALLMVTLLSSNYDVPEKPWGSEGTPESWHAAVLAAKGDDPEAVVVLNILDAADAPGCHPEDRICQMTRMFPYSLTTDHDEKEYGSAFAAATAMVADACSGFRPPG